MQKTLHLFSSSWNHIVFNSSVTYQLPNPPDRISFPTVPPASLSSWNYPPFIPSQPLPVYLCQAEWACGCLCGVELPSTYKWTLTLILSSVWHLAGMLLNLVMTSPGPVSCPDEVQDTGLLMRLKTTTTKNRSNLVKLEVEHDATSVYMATLAYTVTEHVINTWHVFVVMEDKVSTHLLEQEDTLSNYTRRHFLPISMHIYLTNTVINNWNSLPSNTVLISRNTKLLEKHSG